MPIAGTGKERDDTAVWRRVTDKAWWGRTNTAEQAPLVGAGEFILGVNGAGTGVVQLVGQSGVKTIANGAPTSIFSVACAPGTMAGGSFTYMVEVSDGTDFQALSNDVAYSGVNKAAALTTAIVETAANQAKSVSAGTLTVSWTILAGAGIFTVQLQPTTSLAATTFRVTVTVTPGVGTVTLL